MPRKKSLCNYGDGFNWDRGKTGREQCLEIQEMQKLLFQERETSTASTIGKMSISYASKILVTCQTRLKQSAESGSQTVIICRVSGSQEVKRASEDKSAEFALALQLCGSLYLTCYRCTA